MQELTTPVPLTSPYASADGVTMPTAPRLGTPVPGTTGGLPAQQGLNVYSNPLAQQLQSNPNNFNPPMQPSQQPNDQSQYGAQQAPSAYPQELPLSREQAQSRQDQQPMQGYAHGGVAHSAEKVRAHGRGDDTVLIHMTPNEVNSLRGLAQQFGGDLTVNPHTGLPEAGWLGKLLPTILGAVGMAFGIPPVWMGAAGAVGGTIATGDLGKGLLMGLQAYGGASLGGALGVGGKLGQVGASLGLPGASSIGAASTAAAPVTQAAEKAAESTAGQLANIGKEVGNLSFPGTGLGGLGGGSAMGMGMNVPVQNLAGSAINAAGKTGLAGFAQGFGDTAKLGLPGGIVGKAAPMLAAQGVMSGVSNAMTPTVKTAQEQTDNAYAGPYTAQRRTATFAPSTQDLLSSTKERDYFNIDVPEIYNVQGQLVQPGSETAPGTPILQNVLAPDITKKGFLGLGTKTVKNANKYMQQWTPYMGAQGMGYAEGGEVELADGAFVVDARTVSELGNGSSEAGQELLAKLGGQPIKGPGDGVSDSIPAKIDGDQPARVARDEVLFTPEAVRKVGKGSEKRGAQKLYALMDKAHDARRKSARGKDTGLRKGLA